MYKNIKPELISQHATWEEALSDHVRRMHFLTRDGSGELTLMELYPGIQVWAVDFAMKTMTIQPLSAYHFLKLNYCLSGGCEVPLPRDRYVYINEGRLSVDMNPPAGQLILPSGRYAGLEIVIDLQKMRTDPPGAWTECGVDILAGAEMLSRSKGSYLAYVTPEWDRLARCLTERVRTADLSLEDSRFLLLRLLWLLKTGRQNNIVFEHTYLTRGQRTVVMRAEQMISRDLKQKFTIDKLAAEAGVSPASLKKYFTQAYGKPISVYLRELRMNRAKELLSGTALAIADIAGEVGYENQGKFGAAFRRETGVTPLEYRRIHRFSYKEEGK